MHWRSSRLNGRFPCDEYQENGRTEREKIVAREISVHRRLIPYRFRQSTIQVLVLDMTFPEIQGILVIVARVSFCHTPTILLEASDRDEHEHANSRKHTRDLPVPIPSTLRRIDGTEQEFS
jgi:hypothetical protein